jgi:hypothetical protein
LYFLSLNQDVISTEDAHSLIVSIAAEKSAFAIAAAFLVVIPEGDLLLSLLLLAT